MRGARLTLLVAIGITACTPAGPRNSGLRKILETNLAPVAKVDFQSLQAARAGTILSNNSAGVVSNNGGGVLSNNGAGYRLQATDALVPEAGEQPTRRYNWLDRSRLLTFTTADGANLRTVLVRSNGTVATQFRRTQRDPINERLWRYGHVVSQEYDDQGNLTAQVEYDQKIDNSGALASRTLSPSFRTNAEIGLNVKIKKLNYDLEHAKGEYELEYPDLNYIARGTFFNLSTVNNEIATNLADPLDYTSGEGEVLTREGKRLFKISQPLIVTKDGAADTRTYTLQNDLKIVLSRFRGFPTFTGQLYVNDTAIGKVELRRSLDGGVAFQVTSELFDKPVVVGFNKDGALTTLPRTSATTAPTPAPIPRPYWQVLTLAGGIKAGYADGVGVPDALFDNPMGLVMADGFIFVCDMGNNRIRRIKYDPTTFRSLAVTTLAGNGVIGAQDGNAAEANFNHPCGLARAADGTLYIGELDGHRIRKLTPDGRVSTLAGTGLAGTADGPGASAQFNKPVGLALAADGTLYVVDSGSHKIRKVAPDGTVSTLAGTGTQGFKDGAGAEAQFDTPLGIAIGPRGDLFVADEGNGRVRKIAADGTVSTYSGNGSDAGTLDGPAGDCTMPKPVGLAFTPEGSLLVSTQTHNAIRQIAPDGTVTTLIGGFVPVPGSSAIDGVTGEGSFIFPTFVAAEPKGACYLVSDQAAARIRCMTFFQ